ncbi:MAG: RNA polymerase sigma factor [Bacteroidota bacterium]
MIRVKAGEIDKLGILYERYKKRIFGFFYHMNGDKNQSEDLVQNVFVRVLSYKHSYKPQNSFSSWIFQIARNVNYDAFGSRKKGLDSADSLQKVEKFAHPEDIHAQIILGEDLSTLRMALGKLSVEKREFLVLSKLRGLRYKEIADIMECTEGNARTKVHRALNELKDIFHQLETR